MNKHTMSTTTEMLAEKRRAAEQAEEAERREKLAQLRLTSLDSRELWTIVDGMDRDGDGSIDQKEFQQAWHGSDRLRAALAKVASLKHTTQLLTRCCQAAKARGRQPIKMSAEAYKTFWASTDNKNPGNRQISLVRAVQRRVTLMALAVGAELSLLSTYGINGTNGQVILYAVQMAASKRRSWSPL